MGLAQVSFLLSKEERHFLRGRPLPACSAYPTPLLATFVLVSPHVCGTGPGKYLEGLASVRRHGYFAHPAGQSRASKATPLSLSEGEAAFQPTAFP